MMVKKLRISVLVELQMQITHVRSASYTSQNFIVSQGVLNRGQRNLCALSLSVLRR
jgi:hypothetical protein